MICAGLPAPAQHVEIDTPTTTQSGEAYLQATRLRGLEREITYFDPDQPAPPLSTDQTVDQDPDSDDSVVIEGDTTFPAILAGIVVAMILLMAFFARGSFTVSFARDPDTGGEGRIPRQQGSQMSSAPVGLDAILAMQDRKEALVALCRSLLARVMNEEGVLLNKSWTDRDTLRRVPPAHPMRDALRDLIFASEKVQFGGREVTEAEFREHVEQCSPIWKGQGT